MVYGYGNAHRSYGIGVHFKLFRAMNGLAIPANAAGAANAPWNQDPSPRYAYVYENLNAIMVAVKAEAPNVLIVQVSECPETNTPYWQGCVSVVNLETEEMSTDFMLAEKWWAEGFSVQDDAMMDRLLYDLETLFGVPVEKYNKLKHAI